MATEIKIKKVKLTSSGKAEITFDEIITGDDENSTTTVHEHIMKGGNLVHEDFKLAMVSLDVHLAVITEQVPKPKAKTHSDMIHATGYSIGGDDSDSEGVTLIGRRYLLGGKVLNLVAPFTSFDPDQSGYSDINDLSAEIDACNEEAKLYLQGKHAPEAQMEIEFSEVNEEGELK